MPQSSQPSPSSPALNPVDRLLPWRELFLYGWQHVLVMYAGTVTVPLIFGAALGLAPRQLVALIHADLFTCGLATLLQSVGIWRFGARLPLVQGCSFICLPAMILIGKQSGLPTVYGAVIGCGFLTILIAPVFSRLLRYFPPAVIGSVIVAIGLSLMPTAAMWLGGGNPQSADFGAMINLGLGLGTILIILALYVWGGSFISNLSALLGMLIGTVAAILLGRAHFDEVAGSSWVALTRPLIFGTPKFSIVPILVMEMAMLAVMTETTGNCLAIGRMVGRPVSPRILANAFRADGLATMLGGVFNSFPYNAYSQNTGLIALSGVKSRYVLSAAGIIMFFMGLFPKLGAVIAGVPKPVLGGVGLVIFGMTVVAGIEELGRVPFAGTRNALLVAVSIGMGMLPTVFPTLFDRIPDVLRLLLGSSAVLCGFTAVTLNIFLNHFNTPPAAASSDETLPLTSLSPLAMPTETDLLHLRRCIALASQAREGGQHPFAALVVDENGHVLMEAQNQSRPPEGDPTQHAELVAASKVSKLVPPERLAKATLYTSAEPCSMCAGAIYWANIGRFVYALSEQKLLVLTGANEENPTFSLPCREIFARGQRRVEVIGPLLEEEAAKPHDGFWD
jgi:xanthine permease